MRQSGQDAAEDLTPREREIAALLLEGLTYQQIADTLVVSFETVKTHASRTLHKLALHSRHELAWLAKEKGGGRLVQPAAAGPPQSDVPASPSDPTESPDGG
jgi:DNA-binding NarL/FixJ family response regulator